MVFCSGAGLEACAFFARHVALLLALYSASTASDLRSAAADSVSREYSHRIWRVPEGLPQNRIQAISQTPDGYLWIGTAGGLVRFDGVRFFVFDRSNTPEFRDDSILALDPSKDGSLWIGTEGGRLLRYRNGSFQVFGPGEGLTNGFVRALYEDAQGTLWIGTDRGFFRRRGARIERLDGSAGLPVTAITGIAGDAAGRIWAASTIGLLVVDGNVPRSFLPGNSLIDGLRSVRLAHDGSLWLLTSGGVRRLEGEKVSTVPAFDGVAAIAAAEDRHNQLWIGSLGDGLLRTGPAGVISFREPHFLPDKTVLSIFEDREGNLWVGTGDGLLRLSTTAVHVLTSRDGLADDNVSTVYEGRDGTLWLITITGQIFHYKNGGVIPFRLPPPVAAKRFRTAYADSKGNLWFGSSDGGIVRLSHGQTRSFTTADGIRSNMIRQFLEDRRGQIWIALGSGLSRWDGHGFQNYYLEEGLSYGSVRVLKEDRNGDLLVGTDGGLNRVHDGKFVSDPVFAPLDGERIWALHEDRDGLWVGTRGGGLFRIRDGKVARITVRDGLLSNAIYQILEDGGGNLWMSSPAGVFSASRNELDRVAGGSPGAVAVVPYGTAEGLESTQMNGGFGFSGIRAATGDLWFPSVKGAVRIDPGEIHITQPSPVLIESITADEKVVPVSGDIVIPPGPGKLEIHYTAASLRTPERLTFRYKLEGFDPEWSPGSRARTAYYTNLPPGQYRFRVSATDSATPQHTSEAGISFAWQPHFYQTKWFYGICVMTAALCVWASLRIYARQTKTRYALLFAERTRLAREMHDTVIQGCAGVSTLLEAAASLHERNAGRVKELLDLARVQARLTLDEARQAVWDLRHTHLEGDIAATLRDFAHHLSAEKGIPIEVDFSGASAAVKDRTLRSILLIAREAIRNAANHAEPHHIRIRVSFENGEVRLEVVDDGCGFSPGTELAEANGHYGIVGMRERVEQLGGSFLLRSAPGSGTSVIATLPLGSDRRQPESAHSRS